MQDNLAVINRVIEEHRRIRGSITSVGESVNDLEAIFSLQQVYAGWTLSSMEATAEKQRQLQETVSRLDLGLNKHFTFEEDALPPLFGELLMQALLVEHQEIRGKIGEAKSRLADTRLAELDQAKLLQEKSHIQQVINALTQTVEEHTVREETILTMMKKAIEGKK